MVQFVLKDLGPICFKSTKLVFWALPNYNKETILINFVRRRQFFEKKQTQKKRI